MHGQRNITVRKICFKCNLKKKKEFIAQKIQRDTQGYKIVPLTNLPQLSFAEASDRVSTVLGMYMCSSEKQVEREKHCGSWVNGYRRRCLGRLCMYFLYWRWRSARVQSNVIYQYRNMPISYRKNKESLRVQAHEVYVFESFNL